MNAAPAVWRGRVGFGIGGFGVSLVYASLGFLLLYYYTKVLGMPSDRAGSILAVGALSDALLDPVVGWIAGRTRTRWGRYRPYMLFGALPLSLAFIAVFFDPGLTGAGMVTYCLISMTLFRAAFQFIYMPYTSLVVVLSRDAHERSVIEGWRSWFIAAGQLAVSLVGLSVIGPLGHGDERRGFFLLAVIYAVLTAASFLTAGALVREPPQNEDVLDVKHPARIAALLWRNDQFRIVVMATLTCQTGYAMVMSGAMPFFTEAFGNRELARWPLTAVTASALLASFLWPIFARRFGKGTAWMAGVGLASAALLMLFVTNPGSIWVYAAFYLVLGTGAQAMLIMQFATAADTLDYGHWKHGERTEAVGFAVMTMASKASMAVGNGVLGWGFHAVGYAPNSAGQTGVADGMRAVYMLAPLLFYLASLPFLRGYRLSAESHAGIIRDLQARHG